ncbi:type I secretion system permease/ATPase [Pontibacter sp. JAM-7]|uniref:type I secretion system permease/ATPase n=1 Tax=Pontibacter sp. JAM-7 TaxID=3366581 RepID=UPI003AF8F100
MADNTPTSIDSQVIAGSASHFDPLLTSLVILTKLHGNPMSPDSLSQGLPLEGNRLPLHVFPRAAKRARLSCRLLKREIAELSHLVTPCILLLKNGNACVLVDLDESQQRAQVILPEASEAQGLEGEDRSHGATDISLEELAEDYSGHLLAAKPEFRFEKRAQQHLKLDTEHWLFGTLGLSWRIYRDVILVSILINLFALVMPLFTRNIYDRVVPNNAIETLWALTIGAIIIFSFDALLKMMRSYFIDLAGKKADLLLSSELFSRVMSMRMEKRPASVGSFARNIQEFESIRDFVTSLSVTTLVDLPFMLLFLVVIGLIGGPVVWAPIAGILLLVLVSVLLQPLIKNTLEKSSRASTQKSALLIEGLNGLESVKTTGAEGQLQSIWENSVSHIADWNMAGRKYSNLAGTLAAYVGQLVNIGMLVIGVYLIVAGDLSMGGLIASVMLSSRAMQPMSKLISLATRINSTRSAYQSVKNIMEIEVERSDDKKYVYFPEAKGDITFEEVDFNYPDASYKSLSKVSFKLQHGEKLGVIGRIGSGKSTLARLVLGLYQPIEGRVEVDGIDIKQINPTDLRRQIGAVNQDQVLFYGTIRDNIVMGVPHVEDVVISRAAEMAGVMDFAAHHPEGLDMNVGEQGKCLSGGQRQAVLLARALLLDPPILLLDEPTASMDNSTEQRFLQRLEKILPGRTLILVTHKPSTLHLVDKLMVLDSGRMVAYGPKGEVMQQLTGNGNSQDGKGQA